MIRVSHVITGLGVGGAEMMLVKLLAGIDRSRFASVVITLSNELALADRVEQAGTRVRTVEVSPKLHRAPGALRRLTRMLRDSKPDLVQTWLYHADLLGGIAGRLIRVPVIWNVQSSTIDTARISRQLAMVGRTCAVASRIVPETIVSCSWAGMEAHVAMGYSRRPFEVIPNGADLQLFRPDEAQRASVRAELGLSPNERVIGMVARLHPQKDHANFFAAAERLSRTHPDVRFALIGLGLSPDNDETMAMVRAAGVERQTLLLGLRSDIPRLLCGLDLHTLSSSFGEGFPNVLGEAMAAGVPCVVTDVGDSALVVGDTGRTVPPRNPDALATAWRDLLTLPPAEFEALRTQARQRIASRFSIESAIAQYERLYERVAGGGGEG